MLELLFKRKRGGSSESGGAEGAPVGPPVGAATPEVTIRPELLAIPLSLEATLVDVLPHVEVRGLDEARVANASPHARRIKLTMVRNEIHVVQGNCY